MYRIIYHFARSRMRRDMQFSPFLKDLTKTSEFQAQIKEHETNYKRDLDGVPSFTKVLEAPKVPEFKEYFSVNKKIFNKKIKKVINKNLSSMSMAPEQVKLDHLSISDQTRVDPTPEIEAEQVFKKELFRKKQTNLLLKKRANCPQKIVSGDPEYERYQMAKNLIKNNRIHNMLNDNQSNQQLALLIESGLMNDTQNLSKLIDFLKQGTNMLEHHSTDLVQNTQSDIDKLNLTVKDELELIKDYGKLKQFYNLYQQRNEQDKTKTRQIINIMNQAKAFQQSVFQQRYQAINFRFKGRVDFDCFQEEELLTYLKHTKIQPQDLLLIFEQNLNRINRNNQMVVMTPAVVAQVYAKTSLYEYPETADNNRINMLADKKFIRLERYTFENIDKVNDSTFADIVHAFGQNHYEEQGNLKPKMFQKILSKIALEFQDRLDYFKDEDLGCISRAMTKMPILNLLNKFQLIERLKEKVRNINDVYCLESVCVLLSLIDNKEVANVLLQTVTKFAHSQNWDEKTLVNISRSYPSIFKYNKQSNALLKVRQLLRAKHDLIKQLVPKMDLNDVKVVSVFLVKIKYYDLDIFNRFKRGLIDTIKQQKTILQPNTLPLVINSLSHFDYYQRYKCDDIHSHSLIQMFFPHFVLKFNSAKFLPYHQAANFLTVEYQNMNNKNIHMLLRSMSFVRYKNQPFFDSFIERELLEEDKIKDINNLLVYLHCYHLQRRSSKTTQTIIGLILDTLQQVNCKPEDCINTIVAIANLKQDIAEDVHKIEKLYCRSIRPFIKYLNSQQKLSLISAFTLLDSKQDWLWQLVQIENQQALRIEQKMLLSICCLINNKPKYNLDFAKIENQYYQHIQQELKENQIRIGTNYPFDKVQKEFIQALNQQANILPWRIECANKVYFLYSYDMFQSCINQSDINEYKTYGIWTLYQKYYKLKGYQCIIIKTFQWKNLES